jgi:hypothetical protein
MTRAPQGSIRSESVLFSSLPLVSELANIDGSALCCAAEQGFTKNASRPGPSRILSRALKANLPSVMFAGQFYLAVLLLKGLDVRLQRAHYLLGVLRRGYYPAHDAGIGQTRRKRPKSRMNSLGEKVITHMLE